MKSGSLFTGYGGLDLAVESALGVTPAWFCEYEPPSKQVPKPTQAPARILAHHWPDVPNHGDLTKVDWSTVEPVEVLTGGFPCQDVSVGGKRAGLKPGTRSGLWSHMAYAIDQLRPRLVVIENVRGLTHAEAHSDVEPCPWCLGDGSGEPPLRALGAVLGDLADLGYDARWHGLQAADVGAPHARFRIFIVAYPSGLGRGHSRPRIGTWTPDAAGRGEAAADAADDRPQEQRDAGPDAPQVAAAGSGRGTAPDPDSVAVRQQPVAVAWRGRAPLVGEAQHVVADPAGARLNRGSGQDAEQDGRGERPGGADLDRRDDAAAHAERGGRDGGSQVAVRDQVERAVAQRASRGDDRCGTCGDLVEHHDAGGFCAGLCGGTCTDPELGRPETAADANGDGLARVGGIEPGTRDPDRRGSANVAWGAYEPAIRRWERVLGRLAPHPTAPGRKGAQRLNPVFVEWMQGLPAGHVTGVPGLTRNEMLKALGNGVVPQQAIEALYRLEALAYLLAG